MNKENVVLTMWEECKKVFLDSSNENLTELLIKIIEIIKKYHNVFQETADLEFLNYILKMNVNDYIIGTNGDDFDRRIKAYIQQKEISIESIWRILSQLIWDLTIPVTDKICPSCHCDNLILLVDRQRRHIYESCENCFWISQNKIQIMRPVDLFPADKNMVIQHNYLPYIHKAL